MFERYLTDALTTHFGHFVENLDADKVRISAWNGEIVLQDLSLRPNALEYLVPDCPVELAFGRVGNLELRIPWSLFRSQLRWKPGQQRQYLSTTAPCSIVLSDVTILITPRRRRETRSDDNESDDDTTTVDGHDNTKQRQIQKEKLVQSILDGQLLRRVTQSSVSTSRWAWIQDWLSTLLSTLSVTVRNIHVRYEDPGTCMGFVWHTTSTTASPYDLSPQPSRPLRHYRPSFAVGITLQEFSVKSDEQQTSQHDSNGEPDHKDDPSSNPSFSTRKISKAARNKVAAAESLAIYWDSDCNLMAVHSKTLCEADGTMTYSAYYHAAFAATNDNVAETPNNSKSTTTFAHYSLYRHGHSYVLNPISPSLNLQLISRNNASPSTAVHSVDNLESATSLDDSDDTSNDGSIISSSTMPQQPETPSPSSVRIHLPPCKLTLARNTLEDTAYLRKSLSVWKHAAKSIFSEGTLRRLAKLRPLKSPKKDPCSWWRYAVEATLALSTASIGHRPNDQAVQNSNQRLRRRRGWHSFWDAFLRRKQYVALYQTFAASVLQNPGTYETLDASTTHKMLLEMEDILLPQEIVAFRLAFFEIPTSLDLIQNLRKASKPDDTSSSTGWQIWAKSSEKEQANAFQSDQTLLSLRHRLEMLLEMTFALERERANVRNITREEVRQASILHHHATVDDCIDNNSGPVENPITWIASVACKEIAVQINDESLHPFTFPHAATPVIRLSCAWAQDQCWYENGSWDVKCSLASVLVKDMTASPSNHSHGYFPNLISRKVFGQDISNEDDFICIEGKPLQKGLSIAVERRLHWTRETANYLPNDVPVDRGSTTSSRVRIYPMEVVYSTVPVEVATRVLGAVKTPELVDDYHRMAAAAHGWQQRQKKKLLAALAHKSKKIIVDVDVGAPELLIPEDINDPKSPMLAIDLGRLRLYNEESSKESSLDYDDQWCLSLSNIQVRSATVATFGQQSSSEISGSPESIDCRPTIRHLVEPFSLDFTIATRIADENNQETTAETKVRVSATLPRLAFNLNSSSIRLISRLQRQWEKRRSQKTNVLPAIPTALVINAGTTGTKSSHDDAKAAKHPNRDTSSGESTQQQGISRVFQFDFTAPVIRLRLEDDTSDFRNMPHTSTALLDLAFRGIRGTILQRATPTMDSWTTFDARIHSLGAIDLFQTAGKDFALLMSSALPENRNDLVLEGDTYTWAAGNTANLDSWSSKDLVTIQYSSTTAQGRDGTRVPDKLSIGFHELYLEWNPETIATIQKAIRIPQEEVDRPITHLVRCTSESISDDEFFDAIDDAACDAETTSCNNDLISEVQSSSFETAEPDLRSSHSRQSSWSSSAISLGFQTIFPTGSKGQQVTSPHRILHSSITPLSPHQASYPTKAPTFGETIIGSEKRQNIEQKPFELNFALSKLRVSFNKESRHRKVMVAQMDGTRVSYRTRSSGGSRTMMNIGNLEFTDPATTNYATLYSKIVGLKTKNDDSTGDQLSSLLEMEIIVNPKTRSFPTQIDVLEDSPDQPVQIDRECGLVIGCNFFVSARFSPMRFVFLEQLWFEFIDYFFEGIIGNSVWGGQSTSKLPAVKPLDEEPCDNSRYLPGSKAAGFNFTRFDIALDSPELLLPVTYRSPEFLRLDLGSIHVSNKYNATFIDDDGKDNRARMQWFNNCTIALNSLRIFSWSGKELGKNSVIASVILRWPTGPTAPLVTPKWRVKCTFDSLDISLRRTDYALIQHVISQNIGEESRHLNEWQALQKLSPTEFLAYMESILVHFGYDKKDVTPTTYDLKVTIPSVRVEFIDCDKPSSGPMAVARCIDLVWSLRKDADLVVQQKATFDINLDAPSSSSSAGKLLSAWKYDQDILMEDAESDKNDHVPELSYTSTTVPSGDNTKTLEIVNACIYADVPCVEALLGFLFQSTHTNVYGCRTNCLLNTSRGPMVSDWRDIKARYRAGGRCRKKFPLDPFLTGIKAYRL